MCEINKDELNQEQENGINEEKDYDYVGSEEQMGFIAVQEELKRIEIQEKPTSKVSKETKNSDFYKESIIITETVGEVFQKLLGFGIDYNNSLAIASGLVQNDAGIKQLKLQATIQENNQP